MTSEAGMTRRTMPVTMQARVTLEEDGCSQVLQMEELSFEEQLTIQSQVDDEFDGLCSSVPEARLFGQIFSQLMSSILAFREAVGVTLQTGRHGEVCAFGCPTKEGGEARSEEEIRSWAWGRALSDFRVDERRPLGALEFPPPTGRFVERCMTASLKVRSLLLRMRRILRERIRNRGAPVRLLVVSGPGKAWFFERYGVPNARCTFMTPDILNSRFGVVTHDTQQPVRLDDGSDADCVEHFVSSLVAENAEDIEQALAQILSSYDAILTCSEDEPLVRRVLECFSTSGKQAWVFPEGAVPMNDAYWPFYRMFHYSPQGVHRLVFCEQERNFWSRADRTPSKVETIGYFADTTSGTRFDDILVRLWWLLHRGKNPMAPRRKPVLVSFEVLEDSGMTRLGLPSESEMLDVMDSAIASLVESGRYVIAKCRSDLVAGLAQNRYRHLPVFVTSKMPWQSLARLAGGVIARESSLTFEAQYLGLRAVVWNPTHLRGRAEGLLQEFPGSVVVARTGTQLVNATTEMASPQWGREVQKRTKADLRRRLLEWSSELDQSA